MEPLLSIALPDDLRNEYLEKSSCLFRFYQASHAYQGLLRDYAGSGVMIGQAEAHLLTEIADNPGVTTTQLAGRWRKTTAAISQTVTKLENKGMVERRRAGENALHVLLYPTQSGTIMSDAHKNFDIHSVHTTLEWMRDSCTEEEIRSFFKVLDIYIDILHRKNDPSKE